MGDSLVYKDYVALGPTDDIIINNVLLATNEPSTNSGVLALTGLGAAVQLGSIESHSGNFIGSSLRLTRDKLGFIVPAADSTVPSAYNYGSAGDVLTSGGSDGQLSWQPIGTLIPPSGPIYTNAVGVTNASTVVTRAGNFESWNGWNPAENWSVYFKAYKASSDYVTFMHFSNNVTVLDPYVGFARFDWGDELKLFWNGENSDASTTSATAFVFASTTQLHSHIEVLLAYSNSEYTHDGGGSDPDLGVGLKWYIRTATSNGGLSSATWTEVTTTPIVDSFDESDDNTWSSTADMLFGDPEVTVTNVELWNTSRSPSDYSSGATLSANNTFTGVNTFSTVFADSINTPRIEDSGELQLAPQGGTNYFTVNFASNSLRFAPNWDDNNTMNFYNNGTEQTAALQGRDKCHLTGNNGNTRITLQSGEIEATQQITAPYIYCGGVNTPEVVNSGSNHLDLGAGAYRRIRIQESSNTPHHSTLSLFPVITSEGTANNADPFTGYIRFYSIDQDGQAGGKSVLYLRGDDRVQMETGGSYFMLRQTRIDTGSPFYNPHTVITSDDAPWRTTPISYTSNLNGLTLRHTSGNDNEYWNLATAPNTNLHVTFGGVQRGYFASNTYQGFIDFTGQHRSQFEGDYTPELIGLIVESTGTYLELDGSVSPAIDEALPSVRLTSAARSKRVYGVLSGIEGETREYGSGFVTVVPKEDGVTRVMVNSVGEGSLWVVDTNGNLENGDYVCSSNVQGYGQRQEDDLLHSYTVAKITMDLDWANLPDWVQTRRVNADGTISEHGAHLCCFVGVTYHCG